MTIELSIILSVAIIAIPVGVLLFALIYKRPAKPPMPWRFDAKRGRWGYADENEYDLVGDEQPPIDDVCEEITRGIRNSHVAKHLGMLDDD